MKSPMTQALVANNLPVPAFTGLTPLGSLEAYIGAVHQIPVLAVEDEQALARRYRDHGEVHCPHTATAVKVLENLRAQGGEGDWAVAATAHPAKFESVVEPLIGRAVEVPPALADLLSRPAQADPIPADYDALRERVLP